MGKAEDWHQYQTTENTKIVGILDKGKTAGNVIIILE